MKVLSYKGIDICVYPAEFAQRHHLPHCHVRWAGREVVVALPTLRLLVGKRLPKGARKLLLTRLDMICEAWNEKNPEYKISD